jgi:hypothetical protein
MVNVKYCGKPMTDDPLALGWPEKMPERGGELYKSNPVGPIA